MKKISYRLVFNRKKRLNAQGKALLQIEAYLDRKKIYFSTHIYLKPEQWNDKRKVVKKHPHAKELNYMLMEHIIQLERKELDIWKSGQEVSLQMLKDDSSHIHKESFIAFAKDEICHSSTKESTKQNRMTTLRLIEEFRSDLKFQDVTLQLIYDFERFLSGKGMQINTIAKHMKHLRGFVNAAFNKGEMDAPTNPFQRYRIKKQNKLSSQRKFNLIFKYT